jgi:hypothetical protein
MSSKNVKTLRAAHESWNRRDFQGVIRDSIEDLVYTDHGRTLTLNGRDKFREWTEGWAKAFSDGKIGSERESGETCILRGFLKGTYFAPSAAQTANTLQMADKPGLAVEMTLRGRDDGALCHNGSAALGAWKPAKDAGFHIPTATATAAIKLGQSAKPSPIVHFYRFSCRT